MIGQRFAAAYPERVEALVLCATASRIGTPEVLETRIAAVGQSAIVPSVLERWFTSRAHFAQSALVAGFGTMLERTPPVNYIAACRAIRDADRGPMTRPDTVGRSSSPTPKTRHDAQWRPNCAAPFRALCA